MFQNFVNLKTNRIFVSSERHLIYSVKVERESN